MNGGNTKELITRVDVFAQGEEVFAENYEENGQDEQLGQTG